MIKRLNDVYKQDKLHVFYQIQIRKKISQESFNIRIKNEYKIDLRHHLDEFKNVSFQSILFLLSS